MGEYGLQGLFFAITFVLSDQFNVLARRGFIARGWVDDAGDDPLKIHREPVPTSGGVAVYGAWLLVCCAAVMWTNACSPWTVAVLALPGGLLAGLGFLDDRVGLSPRTRLRVQVGVALLWLAALNPEMFTTSLGGSAEASMLQNRDALWTSWKGETEPWLAIAAYLISSLVMVFFIVGGVNAMNMQDGRDGLAGGVAMIALLGSGFACFSLHDRYQDPGTCAFIGAAACLGFLMHNRPPAKVYLGDSGAYFLGFLCAAVPACIFQRAVLYGSASAAAGAVFLVGLPVVDAAVAIARRRLRGVPLFTGDRDHLYDILARRGYGPWAVAGITWGLHAALVIIGLLLLGRSS